MRMKRATALFLAMLMMLGIAQPCIVSAAGPAAELVMSDSAVKGSGERIECTASGLTNPVYTWTSDNTDVAEVTGYGATAAIKYKTEGTATVTVSVTADEGTFTDSKTVTVTGDVHELRNEEVHHSAQQWTHYELVDAPQAGKNYVIASTNTAGTASIVHGEINNDMLKTSSAAVNAGDSTSDNKPYIDIASNNDTAKKIWTVTGSDGAWVIYVRENNKLKKIKQASSRHLSKENSILEFIDYEH